MVFLLSSPFIMSREGLFCEPSLLSDFGDLTFQKINAHTLPCIPLLWELSYDVSIFIHEFYASIFCFVFLNCIFTNHFTTSQFISQPWKLEDEMPQLFWYCCSCSCWSAVQFGQGCWPDSLRSKAAVLISSWFLCRAMLWTYWYKIFVLSRRLERFAMFPLLQRIFILSFADLEDSTSFQRG